MRDLFPFWLEYVSSFDVGSTADSCVLASATVWLLVDGNDADQATAGKVNNSAMLMRALAIDGCKLGFGARGRARERHRGICLALLVITPDVSSAIA